MRPSPALLSVAFVFVVCAGAVFGSITFSPSRLQYIIGTHTHIRTAWRFCCAYAGSINCTVGLMTVIYSYFWSFGAANVSVRPQPVRSDFTRWMSHIMCVCGLCMFACMTHTKQPKHSAARAPFAWHKYTHCVWQIINSRGIWKGKSVTNLRHRHGLCSVFGANELPHSFRTETCFVVCVVNLPRTKGRFCSSIMLARSPSLAHNSKNSFFVKLMNTLK